MKRGLAEDDAAVTPSSCGREAAKVNARENMYVVDGSLETSRVDTLTDLRIVKHSGQCRQLAAFESTRRDKRDHTSNGRWRPIDPRVQI